MKDLVPTSWYSLRLCKQQGSVLIYVLWILVIISTLAFKLGVASNVSAIKNTSLNNQLKRQMQVESAIQFAVFKLIENQWKDESFQLFLNDQLINIQILNESGFLSL